MKPTLHKGKLIRWNDNRGFGFIQPDDGSQEVFLHITALKDVNRRSQVGDFVCYQVVFWAIAILHIIFWLDWLFFGKALINLFLSIASRR